MILTDYKTLVLLRALRRVATRRHYRMERALCDALWAWIIKYGSEKDIMREAFDDA